MIGTKIYKDDMKEYTKWAIWCNENNAVIEDMGAYYEVREAPSPSLEDLESLKLQEVDQWTSAKITGGFLSSCTGTPIRYDSDRDTQLTMQGIALNVNSIPQYYPQGIPVRGYEQGNDFKTVQLLNGQQLMQWMADLSLHIGKCKQEGWAKQEEVKTALSVSTLNSIKLEVE